MSTTEIPLSIDALVARTSQQNTHIVQFHANDEVLIDEIARLIGSALVFGDAAVVIAAASHRERLEKQLKTSGLETESARKEGRYIVLDAELTVAEIYRNRRIDAQRFTTLIGRAIVNAAAKGRGEHPSGSSEAHVRLFVKDGMASLEIQDHGKGVPTEVLDHGRPGGIGQFGVGLRGMSERLEHLGGRLEIISTDRGTTVVATVPGSHVRE